MRVHHLCCHVSWWCHCLSLVLVTILLTFDWYVFPVTHRRQKSSRLPGFLALIIGNQNNDSQGKISIKVTNSYKIGLKDLSAEGNEYLEL